MGRKIADFKYKIGQRIISYNEDGSIKRDITIIARQKIKSPYVKTNTQLKYYKYECNLCEFDCKEHYKKQEFKEELWTSESELNKGGGCACCCTASQIVVEGINDIPTTASWLIPYFQDGYDEAKLYTKCSGQKIYPTCPNCGRVKNKKMRISKIYNRHSINCQCDDGYSYGHKYIFNMLTQLKQEFIDNYTFDWCKFYNPFKQKEVKGEYDFVLEDKKLIIEVDGEFHRNDNNMNGQTKEESKFIDDAKDKLAKNYEIEVVRVSNDGNIRQNILNSDLKMLFDLSDVDWNKCEEFALSSRVKEACKIKRDNPNLNSDKIGKIMGLNGRTIRTYLHKGSEIWDWINYNPKKKIEAIKDGIVVGVFDILVSELSKCSEELLGEHIDSRRISEVCNGIKNQYKGFIFKYIYETN